ncbi:four-carbon acid sugar kinase family protein [Paroceanicella profunda]|uniref:four-carbon acid sugar kinase family protein n=1 Tax=Paroceanicella profunda TaxID=2579971 RepID=UPI0014789351|nr:four-carbon acid sugar kinase family protein [Paroceanicella profunda]
MSTGLAFIADDFTGASDTLGVLGRAGHKVRLHLDLPGRGYDGIAGVATALRSMGPGEIRPEVRRLAAGLIARGARVLHYKVCSTFDSSPEIGSIGAAAEGFRAAFRHAGAGEPLIAVIGGQPGLGRYCHHGTLFAAAADGAVHRIDRHPVMARHPVTPMKEADLRRHLAAQGLDGLALIDERDLAATPLKALAAARAAGARRMLFDLGRNDDLPALRLALEALAAEAPLVCIGPSSVMEALRPPRAAPPAPEPAPRARPVLLFAGSRSALTDAQVAAASRFRLVPVSPVALCAGGAEAAAEAEAALGQGENVLLRLTAEGGHGRSGAEIAAASARLVAGLCGTGAAGALAIAGGDTSSLAMRALAPEAIEYVRDVDPGVSLCRATGSGPAAGLPLILKGGQMGRPDLFDRLVDAM